MRGHIDWKEEGNKWGLYCRWDGLEVGGRVGNGALDEGWSVMKCARVWVGRQRLLYFYHLAIAASPFIRIHSHLRLAHPKKI